jgi:hypothetical protein
MHPPIPLQPTCPYSVHCGTHMRTCPTLHHRYPHTFEPLQHLPLPSSTTLSMHPPFPSYSATAARLPYNCCTHLVHYNHCPHAPRPQLPTLLSPT